MEFEELRTLKECIIDIENTIPTIMGDGNENKAVYAYHLGKHVGRARDIIVKAYRDATPKVEPQEIKMTPLRNENGE